MKRESDSTKVAQEPEDKDSQPSELEMKGIVNEEEEEDAFQEN